MILLLRRTKPSWKLDDIYLNYQIDFKPALWIQIVLTKRPHCQLMDVSGNFLFINLSLWFDSLASLDVFRDCFFWKAVHQTKSLSRSFYTAWHAITRKNVPHTWVGYISKLGRTINNPGACIHTPLVYSPPPSHTCTRLSLQCDAPSLRQAC